MLIVIQIKDKRDSLLTSKSLHHNSFRCFEGLFHLYMFNLISSVTKRNCIADISLEDFIHSMKNPDLIRKYSVDYARSLSRDSIEYSNLKKNLPCVVFNFYHNEYVNGDSVENPTGYLYIDVDNCDSLDLSLFDFVTATWKSLSGNGYGILTKVDGLTETNYIEATSTVSQILNIENDSHAVSIDRLCVLGYDNNIYFNPYSKALKLNISKNEIKKVSTNYINNINIRVEAADTFLKERVRYSNLDELISEIDFNGEPFIDLGNNRLQYAEVYFPDTEEGGRNSTMFSILKQFYALNTWVSIEDITWWASVINRDKFNPMLSQEELLQLIENAYNQKSPELILNKSKRIVFNPDYNFTKKQKQSMSLSHLNRDRKNKNIDKIVNCINNWNFEAQGKITQKKISVLTNLGIATIKRRFEVIKNAIKVLNFDYNHL